MLQWEDAFAIVQGHKFLWWKTPRQFDDGELPVGRIFFSGHAGVSEPSPIEVREFSPEELPRVLSLFGRGLVGQERVTILAPSGSTKEALERVIQAGSIKDD